MGSALRPVVTTVRTRPSASLRTWRGFKLSPDTCGKEKITWVPGKGSPRRFFTRKTSVACSGRPEPRTPSVVGEAPTNSSAAAWSPSPGVGVGVPAMFTTGTSMLLTTIPPALMRSVAVPEGVPAGISKVALASPRLSVKAERSITPSDVEKRTRTFSTGRSRSSTTCTETKAIASA